MMAIKLPFGGPAEGRKIKVNYFYRTVGHILCRWHPKTVQDWSLFSNFKIFTEILNFNTKNATFSNLN